MGTSQGGAVSAIAAAHHVDEVRGFILFYPAFVMVDRARELYESAGDAQDGYFLIG